MTQFESREQLGFNGEDDEQLSLKAAPAPAPAPAAAAGTEPAAKVGEDPPNLDCWRYLTFTDENPKQQEGELEDDSDEVHSDDSDDDDDDDTPLALQEPLMSGLRSTHQRDQEGEEESKTPALSTTTPAPADSATDELSCAGEIEGEEEEEEEHYDDDEEEGEDDDEDDLLIDYPRTNPAPAPAPEDEDEDSDDELDPTNPFAPEAASLYASIPILKSIYKVTDKLGEGTFSTVYKAEPRTGKGKGKGKGVVVALKRIYVSSSPGRIVNELDILEQLRGNEYISHLINVFRCRDQVIAVMSYTEHVDFREYYRILPMSDIRHYFHALFSALSAVHAANIIHRDVKPANFLYNPHTAHGVLCDFGLAERFDPDEWKGKCHHTCPDRGRGGFVHGEARLNAGVQSSVYAHAALEASGSARRAAGAAGGSGGLVVGGVVGSAEGEEERVGYLREDTRQPVRANRAGTRGFRAPEVLLKCQDQTVALDIWSAGVILLCILTKRFPMFNADDDIVALVELGVLFGRKRMEQCAMFHNRTFKTDVPDISVDGYRMGEFVRHLNPDLFLGIELGPGAPPPPSSNCSTLGKRPLGESSAPTQRSSSSNATEGGGEADERKRRKKRAEVLAAIDLVRLCLNPIHTKRWDAGRIVREHSFFVAARDDDDAVQGEEGEGEKVGKRVKRVLL